MRSRSRSSTSARVVPIGALVLLFLAPQQAPAWEATTTHAGLTEQAATTSKLHQRLEKQFGLRHGLYAQLTVPPADAPSLFTVLRQLNPIHGYVPDGRGRLFAMGWLVAGSVIADFPAIYAGNHFFDPTTGKGLSDRTIRTTKMRLRHTIMTRLAGEEIVRNGIPAPDWVVDKNNPMNLQGFLTQYQ